MTVPSVAAFTDTYMPTVNGATYTIRTWRERWQRRGGRMAVVYPMADGYVPAAGEYPVRSLPFPFYEGFRLGLPMVPDRLTATDGLADVIHIHTPFSIGFAGLRHAWRHDRPVVASYHTPTAEYAAYLDVTGGLLEPITKTASERWERLFYGRADAVIVPSESARHHLRQTVGVGRGTPPDTTVHVVPNGVDVERFRPVDPTAFRARHDLPSTPLVGYTGRHGYEKRLEEAVDACAELDREITLVFGGDGPARPDLEARARERGLDARFLGFLDRAELPAFYSALETFVFPSPIETQGLVALEAIACGTPIAAADAGALVDTVTEGETGYRYPSGDVAALQDCIQRCLDERDRLHERCLAARDVISVTAAIDGLAEVYDSVLDS